MSLLRNPSFETGAAPWDRLNEPQAVNFNVETDRNIARSGDNYLRFRTATQGGSMAQDITVTMPSVSALAYVRAAGANNVDGSFAIWDLNANRNISTDFSVGQTWVQLTAMLGLAGGANRPVRIEFYLTTVNADLFIDSVTAF